jgi:hypothetical protein
LLVVPKNYLETYILCTILVLTIVFYAASLIPNAYHTGTANRSRKWLTMVGHIDVAPRHFLGLLIVEIVPQGSSNVLLTTYKEVSEV